MKKYFYTLKRIDLLVALEMNISSTLVKKLILHQLSLLMKDGCIFIILRAVNNYLCGNSLLQ